MAKNREHLVCTFEIVGFFRIPFSSFDKLVLFQTLYDFRLFSQTIDMIYEHTMIKEIYS